MKGPVVNAFSQMYFPPIPRAGNRTYPQMGNAEPHLSWESKAQPLGECGTPPSWGVVHTPNRGVQTGMSLAPCTNRATIRPDEQGLPMHRLTANRVYRAPRLSAHAAGRRPCSPGRTARRYLLHVEHKLARALHLATCVPQPPARGLHPARVVPPCAGCALDQWNKGRPLSPVRPA